jgi:NlpC/P60 family putative phage cell wall peptidase
MLPEREPITRERIVAVARSWRGTPYHHQASAKGVGTDCLGLIRGVWTELYGTAPEEPPGYSADWAEASGRETLLDAAQRHLVPIAYEQLAPGDVLVFRYRVSNPAKHVAILTDPRRMLHAIQGMPVSEHAYTAWWSRRLVAAFAFPNLTSP